MTLIVDCLVGVESWVYNYATDFCINAANLLGIDYITFGSLFFGGAVNGVMVLLVVANLIVGFKKNSIFKSK